jgi:hypothetical protein
MDLSASDSRMWCARLLVGFITIVVGSPVLFWLYKYWAAVFLILVVILMFSGFPDRKKSKFHELVLVVQITLLFMAFIVIAINTV